MILLLDRMLKECLVLFLCVLEIRRATGQTCTCMPVNTCYQPLPPTDGSGIIDIRIVNSDPTTTVPPTTTPPSPTCQAGYESCCTPQTGCGVRWNVPPTPITTAGPGQARYGSQPWQAVILGLDNTYVGGGVLLDNLNVLTAAHKIANRTAASIKIRMGEWDSNRAIEPYDIQEALVIQLRIHSQYTASNLQNDIAVLRLASPIKLGPDPNPVINTACLPTATMVFDNMKCLVSGWGKDAFTGTYQSILKEVEVPVVSNNDCQTRLRATRLGSTFVLNPTSFMCAGGEAQKDACVGDGGGGLMCSVNGKYQVVGLVSWGIGCAQVNVPGVYVKVQSYLTWIQQNLS